MLAYDPTNHVCFRILGCLQLVDEARLLMVLSRWWLVVVTGPSPMNFNHQGFTAVGSRNSDGLLLAIIPSIPGPTLMTHDSFYSEIHSNSNPNHRMSGDTRDLDDADHHPGGQLLRPRAMRHFASGSSPVEEKLLPEANNCLGPCYGPSRHLCLLKSGYIHAIQ